MELPSPSDERLLSLNSIPGFWFPSQNLKLDDLDVKRQPFQLSAVEHQTNKPQTAERTTDCANRPIAEPPKPNYNALTHCDLRDRDAIAPLIDIPREGPPIGPTPTGKWRSSGRHGH
jgi:hypothetical protein